MRTSRFLLPAVAAGVLALSGCGGGTTEAPTENLKKQGAAKLDSMKALAEAIGKNDQAAVQIAVDALVASNIDVKADPAQAKEIVDLYKSKVKGKLKGDAAGQVQTVVASIEQELK